MSISGRDVYNDIQEKITAVEAEERVASARVHGVENQLSGLMAEREQLFGELAHQYLPALDAASVAKTLRELRTEVQHVFAQKQQRRAELGDRIEGLQKTRHEIEDHATVIDKTLIEKEGCAREADAKAKLSLEGNQEYAALAVRRDALKATIMDKEQRRAKFEQQATQKAAPFRQEPLFRYLMVNGYGTDAYQRTGLVAKLDKWVAHVVHFNLNKQKYDVLTKGVELIRQDVNADKKAYDGIVKQRRDIEQRVNEAHNVPVAYAEVEKSEEEKKQVRSRLDDVAQDYQVVNRQLAELDTQKDAYHIEAVQKLKAYLKGQSIQELRQRAQETPGTEDDEAVDHIENIDQQVRRLKDEAKAAQAKSREVSDKLAGLNKIASHFSNESYDSHRSYYDNDFDTGSLLTAYLLGQASVDHVTHQLDDNHHETVEHSYSSSSSHSSDSDSSSFSSSSSFDSGGGFSGGGGFDTGGGF